MSPRSAKAHPTPTVSSRRSSVQTTPHKASPAAAVSGVSPAPRLRRKSTSQAASAAAPVRTPSTKSSKGVSALKTRSAPPKRTKADLTASPAFLQKPLLGSPSSAGDTWTPQQIKDLEKARASLVYDLPGLWHLIARGVAGKSYRECQAMWETLHPPYSASRSRSGSSRKETQHSSTAPQDRKRTRQSLDGNHSTGTELVPVAATTTTSTSTSTTTTTISSSISSRKRSRQERDSSRGQLQKGDVITQTLSSSSTPVSTSSGKSRGRGKRKKNKDPLALTGLQLQPSQLDDSSPIAPTTHQVEIPPPAPPPPRASPVPAAAKEDTISALGNLAQIMDSGTDRGTKQRQPFGTAAGPEPSAGVPDAVYDSGSPLGIIDDFDDARSDLRSSPPESKNRSRRQESRQSPPSIGASSSEAKNEISVPQNGSRKVIPLHELSKDVCPVTRHMVSVDWPADEQQENRPNRRRPRVIKLEERPFDDDVRSQDSDVYFSDYD